MLHAFGRGHAKFIPGRVGPPQPQRRSGHRDAEEQSRVRQSLELSGEQPHEPVQEVRLVVNDRDAAGDRLRRSKRRRRWRQNRHSIYDFFFDFSPSCITIMFILFPTVFAVVFHTFFVSPGVRRFAFGVPDPVSERCSAAV